MREADTRKLGQRWKYHKWTCASSSRQSLRLYVIDHSGESAISEDLYYTLLTVRYHTSIVSMDLQLEISFQQQLILFYGLYYT